MVSLNKIMLIGNLGTDPEMRFTPSGTPVTSFMLLLIVFIQHLTGSASRKLNGSQ